VCFWSGLEAGFETFGFQLLAVGAYPRAGLGYLLISELQKSDKVLVLSPRFRAGKFIIIGRFSASGLLSFTTHANTVDRKKVTSQ
jgi:hypothetical protein